MVILRHYFKESVAQILLIMIQCFVLSIKLQKRAWKYQKKSLKQSRKERIILYFYLVFNYEIMDSQVQKKVLTENSVVQISCLIKKISKTVVPKWSPRRVQEYTYTFFTHKFKQVITLPKKCLRCTQWRYFSLGLFSYNFIPFVGHITDF